MSRLGSHLFTRQSRFPERMLHKGESAMRAIVPETVRQRPTLFASLALLLGLGGVLYYFFGPELHRYLRMRRM